ncbi:MAG: hypothetical protein ABF904_13570 [Ethanoligenens sp.]
MRKPITAAAITPAATARPMITPLLLLEGCVVPTVAYLVFVTVVSAVPLVEQEALDPHAAWQAVPPAHPLSVMVWQPAEELAVAANTGVAAASRE